ncbi:curli-like amyloid fiber formation chaperone CsgH [Sphingomonas profundi]|uniref:curli-like amyloid fiber formation chaperone CsgH n=1 Tax=Alterirhizorhabdus profundi TaxID=2681549 RepID=UPI0012E70752|nr:curli-like amyloid fiber formation chaperone CsgH [Sphingomonas profundi]
MTALLLAALAASQPAPPITLIVLHEKDMLRLNVVGLSPASYRARYTLEVAGQGPSGVNRTSQSGAATLTPGKPATLLSVVLGRGGAGRWTATLVVTPAEGAPYRQQRDSAESQP